MSLAVTRKHTVSIPWQTNRPDIILKEINKTKFVLSISNPEMQENFEMSHS